MSSATQALADLPFRCAEEHGARVYVVLDGAADPRIVPQMRSSGAKYTCLFKADMPEALQLAAPYLVWLKDGTAFGEWLQEEGWGQAWGIVVISDAKLKPLVAHLRRYLVVHTEAGTERFFRYYDPRVLADYLPTCEPPELDYVFGPVKRFMTEAEHGEGGWTQHAWEGGAYSTGPYTSEDAPAAAPEPAPQEPVAAAPEPETASVSQTVTYDLGRWLPETHGRTSLSPLRAGLLEAPDASAMRAELTQEAHARASALGAVQRLVQQWEAEPAAFEPSALRAALEGLPLDDPDTAFVTLTECLDGKLNAGVRAAAKVPVAALRGMEEIRALALALDAGVQGKDDALAPMLLADIEVALRGAIERVNASPAAEEKDLTRICKTVASRLDRMKRRKEPTVRSISAALTSLRITLGLKSKRPVEPALLAARAAALEDALRVTATQV